MQKPTALFIGHFQPYHKGHHLVIAGMTKLAGKMVVGVMGKKAGKERPFSMEERKDMMQRALQADDIIPMFDVNFVELPEFEDSQEWVEKVLELVGSVDKLWSGDEKMKALFEGKLEVQNISEVPGINAADIREAIRKGGDWEEKVPEEVLRAVKEFGGQKRLQ
jgi:nicotinamide-nucleotide adenylyltransferase